MDYALTMVKKSLVLHGNELEIYHAGFIETKADFDLAVFAAMNYLYLEGFLDDRTPAIEHTHVFDYIGKQIVRENCNI